MHGTSGCLGEDRLFVPQILNKVDYLTYRFLWG